MSTPPPSAVEAPPARRVLPPLADGMSRAARPTGPIVAVLVTFAALALGAVPTVILELSAVADATVRQLTTLFGFGIAWLGMFLWVRLKERRPFATVGFADRRRALPRIGAGALIGLVTLSICVLLPVILGGARLSLAPGAWSAATLGVVLVTLVAFGVQGSTEELVARGYLTQAVARRWGLVAAIVVQTVYFAALHGANDGIGVVPLLNLALVALLLSFWSLAEGSLWGVCAFHAVWNWSQGALFGAPVSGQRPPFSILAFEPADAASELLTGGAFGIEGSLVTTGVLLVAATIAFLAFRRGASR